jgi:hypothetical protein
MRVAPETKSAVQQNEKTEWRMGRRGLGVILSGDVWRRVGPSCPGPTLPVESGGPSCPGPTLPVESGGPSCPGPTLPVESGGPSCPGPTLPVESVYY